MASTSTRRRFSTFGDWHLFLNRIASEQGDGAEVNLLELRQAVYRDIEKLRGRPLIVYAAQFPGTPAGAESKVTIDQADVDGFTDLVDSITESKAESKAIDVLLQSPGGSPEATERIVAILRASFTDVAFLIPHSAFSAATMLAMSGNEIIMHSNATLGPIDPQLGSIPARSIRRGFSKVQQLLAKEGPKALTAYLPMIEKYSIHLLEQCDDALELSKELVRRWLTDYMFGGQGDADNIEKIVSTLSDYDLHKTHSRPFTVSRVREFGIPVTEAEGELRFLLREAHIVINGFFNLSPFVKVYENSQGLSWGPQHHPKGALQLEPMPEKKPATA